MQNNKMLHKLASISIAPMIDISTTHFRYFIRLLTTKATVYTEMIHYNAILNNHQHILPFNHAEHPVVLQLGGSNPQLLAEAAYIAQKYGYDEINLNVGCPSSRVQQGSFGACLMKQPQLVRQCMQKIIKAVSIPCTVKCRLGVDEFDSYEFVKKFVEVVSENGNGSVRHFIIHARKAYLKGLNPAQNRNIPPLQYQKVYQLQQQFPTLSFTLNGGIKTLKQAKNILTNHYQLYGCMIGRTAYENPFQLIRIDELFYSCHKKQQKSRKQILYEYADYVYQLDHGKIKDHLDNTIARPNSSVLIKPLINLYHGEKYCAKYRQMLSNVAQVQNQSLDQLIRNAANFMEEMNQQKIRKQQIKSEIEEKQIREKKEQNKIRNQQESMLNLNIEKKQQKISQESNDLAIQQRIAL